MSATQKIKIIDSHTGGEPTRVVIDGGPDLGNGSLAERREIMRERFDDFRSAVNNEPRGSDVLVGALLTEPVDKSYAAGVIFFNNVGYLNMCGHGMIGFVVTLGHMGRIEAGEHRIETPVGEVTAWLHGSEEVSFRNVPSYRHAKDVTIDVADYGEVTGDIAWGGNWFFLVNDHGEEVSPSNIERLTLVTWGIRQTLTKNGISGESGGEIDHIELFGPPQAAGADSKNFVLCPGKAYDRSPCGTGTSAKLACLIEDGKLQPGETWRQESIVGSIFEGSAIVEGDHVIPTIKGSAFVTAEATLILQDNDPFKAGFRS